MDTHIRELERRYAESNSEQDAEALLNARLRAGEPSPAQLLELFIKLILGRRPTSIETLQFLNNALKPPEGLLPTIHQLLVTTRTNSSLLDGIDERLSNLENQL